MANISSAFGQVTIQAPSPELLKKLLIVQSEFEKDAHYDTTIDYNKNELDEQIHKLPNENVYEFSTTFAANGRWSFESNVTWFFDLLKYPDKIPVTPTPEESEIIELKKELRDYNFTVIFNFTDSESGCDFIEKGIATVTWNAAEQKSHVDYNIHESHNYTVEALIDCGIYDKGEVMSVQTLIDDYDEIVKNEDPIFLKYRNKFMELLLELPYKDTILYEFYEMYDLYSEFDDLVNELKTRNRN